MHVPLTWPVLQRQNFCGCKHGTNRDETGSCLHIVSLALPLALPTLNAHAQNYTKDHPAVQVLADGCSVNRAIDKILECEESDDDLVGQVGLQPQLPGDLDVPMGSSQSNPLSHQGPPVQDSKQKRPPKSAPVQPVVMHRAASDDHSMSQAQVLSQSQPLSRAGSSGAVRPSRLGAAGQGRASGCSQQVGQSSAL